VIGALFLPSPLEVLRVLVRDLLTGDRVLLDAAMVSAVRIVAAFAAAALVALPLGILMGAYEPVNRLVDPIMAPLRYMPISAFIPLTILWFGIGERQKIAFLFLGVFVYLLPVVITAIRAVPEELVQTALTLGASRFQVIRSVLVPAAMPDIFDSFRVMNAISWTYVILAEFVNTTRGLGYLIKLAGDRLKTSEMFAGVIIIGAIGLGTDALLRGLARLFYPWREAGNG
jgi:NitT/TauT family transport system permease protein